MNNDKVIIQSSIQCMEMLNSIIDNTYSPDKIKYASYISMNYFVKNLNSFSKEYIEKILSHEVLGISISAKYSYDLLENAVNNNTVFPAYSKKWFNNIKANQELLKKYLAILVNSEDTEQLKDFCDINPALSKNYYVEHYPKNHAFEKHVIAHNPVQLINQRLLTETDIIDLIKNGNLKYEHFKRVFYKYSYKVQSLVSKNEIEFILNYDITKENKEDLVEIMAVHPAFFIRKLQEKDKQFTHDLLQSAGRKISESNIEKHPNLLQSLIIKNVTKPDSLKDIIAISLDQYNDILFKDVQCFVGRMKSEYQIEFLIYIYEKEHYGVFNTLSYFNEELTPDQKEITLNAVFDCVLDNYNNLTKVVSERFDMDKYMKPLLNFKYADLNNKIIQFTTQDKVDPAILEDMEKYFLHNKLSEKLVEKNIQEKRLKI